MQLLDKCWIVPGEFPLSALRLTGDVFQVFNHFTRILGDMHLRADFGRAVSPSTLLFVAHWLIASDSLTFSN